MSESFEIDVRDLLSSRIADAPGALEWSEVERRVSGSDRPASPGRRPSGPVVWLAISAAAVVAVAGVVVFVRDDAGSVVIDDGPTTIDEPTPPTEVEQPDPTIDENGLDQDESTNDDEDVPDVDLGATSGGFAPIEPGAWHVAATAGDLSISSDELEQVAEQIRQWPGVLDVEIVADADEWKRLTGLTAGLCVEDRAGPPCGPGVVLLVADRQQQPVGRRLESELAMVTLSPDGSPVEFVEAYFAAAVDRASPVPLRFDPAPLGTELTLSGPWTDITEDRGCERSECGIRDEIAVEVDVNGEGHRFRLAIYHVDFGPQLVLYPDSGSASADIESLLAGSGGTAGIAAWSLLGQVGELDQGVVVVAGLPLDVAVVTAERSDGSNVWQRPLAGMAVLPGLPGSPEDPGFDPDAVTTVQALDADGNQILLVEIGLALGSTMVTDLRVDPDRLAAAEAALAQVFAETSRIVEVGDLTVTWNEAIWTADEGPAPGGLRWTVSTPAGVLGIGEQGSVWRWTGDGRWHDVEGLQDHDIDWIEDGGDIVIASGHRRGDGESVMLRSTDGLTWSEIDMSRLDTSGLDVETLVVRATSASGLSVIGSESETGIVAVIDDERIVETHDPPWMFEGDVHFFEVLDDVEDGPVVIRNYYALDDGEEVSEAWRYLGDGRFAPPTQIPTSFSSARLGDTILRFDRTDTAFSDDRRIFGQVSDVPVFSTSNGTDWSVHSTLPAETNKGLGIHAGEFFWVSGLPGSSSTLERAGTFATIWLSTDAERWSSLDVSMFDDRSNFKVVGDKIFVFKWNEDDNPYWIGHVEQG